MKILLIEDDRELAESMKFQLEKEGYETDICDDGEEGLYYMKERSHDLVILDRMLPSMDGITVLQEARKNHVSTPVIMLTALGELQDKLTGLKGGADDYMVKALFAFEELLARIQCMVEDPEDGRTRQYYHSEILFLIPKAADWKETERNVLFPNGKEHFWS